MLKPQRAKQITTAVLVGLAVLAGVLELAQATRCSVGLKPDSISYVAVARSLVAGSGFATPGSDGALPPDDPLSAPLTSRICRIQLRHWESHRGSSLAQPAALRLEHRARGAPGRPLRVEAVPRPRPESNGTACRSEELRVAKVLRGKCSFRCLYPKGSVS